MITLFKYIKVYIFSFSALFLINDINHWLQLLILIVTFIYTIYKAKNEHYLHKKNKQNEKNTSSNK